MTIKEPDAASKLTPTQEPYLATPEGRETVQEIDLFSWVMGELNVPLPSEDGVLLDLSRSFVRTAGFTDDELFVYRDYPHMLAERGWDIYTPSELLRLRKFPPFRNR